MVWNHGEWGVLHVIYIEISRKRVVGLPAGVPRDPQAQSELWKVELSCTKLASVMPQPNLTRMLLAVAVIGLGCGLCPLVFHPQAARSERRTEGEAVITRLPPAAVNIGFAGRIEMDLNQGVPSSSLSLLISRDETRGLARMENVPR